MGPRTFWLKVDYDHKCLISRQWPVCITNSYPLDHVSWHLTPTEGRQKAGDRDRGKPLGLMLKLNFCQCYSVSTVEPLEGLGRKIYRAEVIAIP